MASNLQSSLDSDSKSDRYLQIFRAAVATAQQESRQQGIPNVFCIDGQIRYQLPNGELTLTDPYPTNRQVGS